MSGNQFFGLTFTDIKLPYMNSLSYVFVFKTDKEVSPRSNPISEMILLMDIMC